MYSNISSKATKYELSTIVALILHDIHTRDLSHLPIYERIVSNIQGLHEQLQKDILPKVVHSNLRSAHDARRNCLMNINLGLKSATSIPTVSYWQEAVEVSELFGTHQYSKMLRFRYEELSIGIDALLRDFNQEEVKKQLAAIPNMELLASHLAQAQKDFEDIQFRYLLHQKQKRNTPTATTVKKQICQLINNQLVPFHNLVADSDEEIADIADRTDTLFVRINLVIQMRATRRRNAREKKKGGESG
ncbi:MAG: DUF6261 family protein [Mangrovibacterium sp.]